jgi:hypothetical protein
MNIQSTLQVMAFIAFTLVAVITVIKARIFPKLWQWDFDFPILLLSGHVMIFYTVLFLDTANIIDAHVIDPTLFTFWSTALRLVRVAWKLIIALKLFRMQRENNVD